MRGEFQVLYLPTPSLVLVTGLDIVENMSSSESPCYTVIFESSTESSSSQELRAGLEKGSDEVKIDTLRKILVSTINGNPQVKFFAVYARSQYSVSLALSC
jgi:hypothetical protein